MEGRLFTLFDQVFPSYFVLLIVGFVFAAAIGTVWAKRIGQDPDVIVDLSLAMLITSVVGSRLLHVLADGYFWDYVHICTDPTLVDIAVSKAECHSELYAGTWDAAKGVCHPERDCLKWAKFWAGGLTFYGGLLGATAAAWFLLKRDRFPFWKAADMAGMTIPVGLGFGRLGCLLAGCCFGQTTDAGWALVFPSNSPASEWQSKHDLLSSNFLPSLPVHPTQLYESVAAFGIAAWCLLYLHGNKRYDGQVFVAFVGLYATARFVLEFWRSDDRGGVLGLSTSQLVGLVLAGVALAVHRHRSARRVAPT